MHFNGKFCKLSKEKDSSSVSNEFYSDFNWPYSNTQLHFSSSTEHQIPEIRERAIKNVQSKFHSCRVDLDDLNVNVQLLIRRLIDWFDLKPVTHEKQIFDILLTLLKVSERLCWHEFKHIQTIKQLVVRAGNVHNSNTSSSYFRFSTKISINLKWFLFHMN